MGSRILEKVRLRKNIALLTDFGLKDIFAGVLKGVISSICPNARIIDVTHQVMPQDIEHASFLLLTAYRFFPKDTVFCVVVDPGVGSNRKAICIKTKDYYFIGPDNGLLWQAAKANNIEKIIHLTNEAYFLNTISATFHGRDIFAPCAAHICCGVPVDDLGPPLQEPVVYEFSPIERKSNILILSIIHIDRFGNVTLNISQEAFEPFQKQGFCLEINHYPVTSIYDTYAAAPKNELFVIAASNGFMEISLKNENAAERINARMHQKAALSVEN
ncbi:MAG: SAM-dependent chlorinase/fluorinase [Desulfobacteraceae bacterium]|nr:SAM-dependent chlorinase/fluorinase [Desulfobacteraceae bacterium]